MLRHRSNWSIVKFDKNLRRRELRDRALDLRATMVQPRGT
jgi:hypothetical protein